MPLKFTCTNCGHPIVVKFLKPGEMAQCRNCGAQVKVPLGAESTDDEPVYKTDKSPETSETVTSIDIESLAGRGQRFLAHLLDSVILLAAESPIFWAHKFPPLFLLAIWAVLIIIVIQIIFLSRYGQTIGKMLLKIKIVMIETRENGGFVANVLLRVIVNSLLGILPLYSLIDILLIFRDDRRCIHDLIARTIVIRQ
jgi:uncharacterized RDD family membrane protein YckC/ribosomal protein S27E